MHHGCAGTRWSFPAKDDTATLGRQGPGKTISATGVFEMEPQERFFVVLLLSLSLLLLLLPRVFTSSSR